MKSKYLVHGGVIASLYISLTLFTMPISYGVMQVRIAEALTVLPAFTPAAIPGLFVGCLISNILGPNGVVDIVFGSLATLLAAIATYKVGHSDFLVPLPPVLLNGIIIGSMWSCILWVGLGEACACYGLGLPLVKYLNKRFEL